MHRGDAEDSGVDVVRYAEELRAWAGVVDDAASAVGALVAALPGAWADPLGREWAERLQLVGTELARRAEEAEHLAWNAGLAATDPDAGLSSGIRLGGQSGTRVTERRGMVIPILPPP